MAKYEDIKRLGLEDLKRLLGDVSWKVFASSTMMALGMNLAESAANALKVSFVHGLPHILLVVIVVIIIALAH